ncbi:hypothetical protein ACTXOR_08825 [Arthrobacter rhombi]|uniref:hypothetical protein n=1 Tax=Arthrobacter rhombi TaxID=71253 RepID=UPI003FD46FC1
MSKTPLATNTSPDRSLVWASAVLIAAVGLLGWWLTYLFTSVSDETITPVFTNISVFGGVAGGLSLTGTAVLTLNSRYLARLMAHYGVHIRAVLFGGYCFMMAASLACAVVSAFVAEPWSRWVLGYATAFLVAGILVTALMINSAFSLYLRQAQPATTGNSLTPDSPKE